MGPLTWTRSALVAMLVGGGIGWLVHALGAPDLLAAGAGLAMGFAGWRPPRQTVAALESMKPVTERPPGLALGLVSPGLEGTPGTPGLALGRPVLVPLAPSFLLLDREPFRLALAELQHHVAVIGATGSGKTTTLGRFVDAALAAGWPVVIVDAKGGRLADVSRALARRHGVPDRVWLPGRGDSWNYDICAGEPTAIANRLIGAFQHGAEGEVYRNLSQALLPIVARGLQQSGLGCDLDQLRFALDRPRLVGLARRVADPALKAELLMLLDDDLHKKAMSGLAGRLGALRHGAFGPWLMPAVRTLDLPTALHTPGITYIGLPATGVSEDVTLMGRVVVQDLKQATYAALWTQPASPPALLVIDEFASLGEASQLVDLLLQAREARLALVVSSQHVPRTAGLRHGVLGAGTLVLHQIGSPEDADLLARALGVRTAPEIVRQIQVSPTGPGVRRQVRPATAFLISPDDLRRLGVGQAVVAVRFGQQRTAIVQVDPLRLLP